MRAPTVAAVLAALCLTSCVVFLAAGPLTTNDMWWHLMHGGAYLAHGPWPQQDPCLATAERGPIPHQWLFALLLQGVENTLGLHGLRVLHAVAVAGIALLAWSILRRESLRAAPACLALAVWLALAWYRLAQLRPELASIAAALGLFALVIAPAVPSWRRVALAVLLVAVWANFHALFLVGPLLLLAALAGVGVRLLAAARGVGLELSDERGRAVRLGATLVLSLLASLANPRGIQQHLAYLTSRGSGAIQNVVDEWAPFDPLSWSNYAPAVTGLSWVLTDLLLVLLAVAVAVRAVALARSPSRETLEAIDPVRLALAVAGVVALMVSIRFLWLGVFALLFLLRAAGSLVEARPRSADAVTAVATLVVAAAFPVAGGFRTVAGLFPREPAAWLSKAVTEARYFPHAVDFLAQTQVEGEIFHTYPLGGYLCYRLAPRVRTFVDGSMNFSRETAGDYHRVNIQRGSWPYETDLDVLDRNGVDLFLGVGVPVGGPRTAESGIYTTANLERAEGWLLAARTLRSAVYLRTDAANRENLARVAAWYAEQGVPFDTEEGLDPNAVIRERPDWAAAHGLLPSDHPELVRALEADEPAVRVGARERLGLAYALAGAYELGIANDAAAAEERPAAKAPLRRLVYHHLRRGDTGAAIAAVNRLIEIDPRDRRTALFAAVANRLWRWERRTSTRELSMASPVAPDAPVNSLPLLISRDPLRQ